MTINKTKVVLSDKHKNFMGGNSFDIHDPILELMCISASSFFGEPAYYDGQKPHGKRLGHAMFGNTLSYEDYKHLREVLDVDDRYFIEIDDELDHAQIMEKSIDAALDFDAKETLRWAVTLRKEENIRVTPQVIMVRAANHPKVRGTGMIREFAPNIILRADEPATQMAYQLAAFGKPFPKALQRSWADFLAGATEYQLTKYRMEGRVVKTVDVANMAFGKGFYGYDLPVGKLLRGELSFGDNIKTWESIRSGGGDWKDAVKVMGHMALLRNIRNFVQNGVDTSLWLKKLVSTAEKGKQLPFRYLSAYMANKEQAPEYVLDAIEECLMLSMKNLPTLPGKSLVLSDNSGSARQCPISELGTMSVAQIGNLMGVLTGYISDECLHGVFGDRVAYTPIRKRSSVLDQTEEIDRLGDTVGAGTENGIWLALSQAINEKTHWDNIFIYSDMQAGHGGLYGIDMNNYKDYWWEGNRYIDVAKMIRDYRNQVNKKVNVFMVQTAGYKDTLVPEYYDRTFILGGWSGSIFRFARKMIDISNIRG